MDESNTSRKHDLKVPQSYKEWKQHQNQLELQQAKQLYNSSPILSEPTNVAKEKKKNVTFQSPTGMPNNDRNFIVEQNRRPSQTASPHNDFGRNDANIIHTNNLYEIRKQQNVSPKFESQQNTPYSNESHTPNLNRLYGHQHETNSPDNAIARQINGGPRHADESDGKVSLDDIYRLLTDLQVNTKQPNEQSNRMTDFMQRSDQQVTHSPSNQQHQYDQMNVQRMSANNNLSDASDAVPTTRDLFNIVVKQQEQLMNIQKQIHMLLMHTMNNAGDSTGISRKPQHIRNNGESPIQAGHLNRPKAVNPIGLMTSLEINVQHCNRNAARKQCGCQCECNDRPKYGHTSESDISDQDNEHYPNVHAGDGDAGDGTVNADWMFYGNVLNQVNEVLEKTSPKTNRSPISSQPLMHADQQMLAARNTVVAADSNNERPNFCSAKVKQFGFQIDDVNISAKSKR